MHHLQLQVKKNATPFQAVLMNPPLLNIPKFLCSKPSKAKENHAGASMTTNTCEELLKEE
jgi:tRNA1(Val) A37 N6-methylase TrmN6